MKKIRTLAILLLLSLTAFARAAAPLENRIPADALLYVGWQGADALAPQYAQSNFKGFIDNCKVADYIAENLPNWILAASHGDPDAARDINDLVQGAKLLWRRPMALYVGPMTFANPQVPSFKVAWICDAGPDAPTLEQLFKNLTEKNSKHPGPPPELKLAVTRDQNIVIITLGDAAPEMFAPANAGRINSAPAYLAAFKGLRPDPALTLYADLEKILANVNDGIAKSPAPAEVKQRIPAALAALGLTSLTQFAYAGGFDKKEWAEDAFVGIKGPRVGLLTLLDVAPVSDETLRLVPKDAAAFTVGKADLTKLLAEARRIIKQVAPEQAAGFEQGLAQANAAAAIDIEKDVIAPLGDEWLMYRGPRAEDMTSHPFVFVQKLRDPATFQKTLEHLAEGVNDLAQGKIKIEPLDTGTITVTGIRAPFLTVAWTVRENYLYVSNLDGIAAAVDQVEKKGPSILENHDYLALRKALPNQKPAALSYSEPAKLYPDVYQLLMAYLPMARLAGLDIPGDLIPVPRRLAPFMTPGGSISWADADGFHLSGRTAFPGAEILSGQISGGTIAVPATVAILVPSLAKARGQARVVKTQVNLHQICVACYTYASNHNDAFPDQLAQLVDENIIKGAAVFVSARSGTQPLVMTPEMLDKAKKDFPAFAKEFDAHCDFVYLGKGLKGAAANANDILCYEKPGPGTPDGIDLLFVDGHVEFVKIDALPERFKSTNESLKARGEKPVDTEAFIEAAPTRH